MNDGNNPQRRMTRCPGGHVFDAAAHEACPACGAGVAPARRTGDGNRGGDDRGADPAPPPARPAWLIPALIAAGAAVVLMLAVVLMRGAPEPSQTTATQTVATQSAATQNEENPSAEQREAPRRAAPEVAGLWEIYVPGPAGQTMRWTIDFAADGAYTFTDTTNGARHAGTYRSQNGEWSLTGRWTGNPVVPDATPFDDSGTYRLIAADTLELSGRYGVGVWKRVSGAN
jgi:hypothetical protein